MRTATSLFAILLGVSALPKIPQAQAQTLNVLHSFTGAPDGAFPMASLVRDKEGNLYGTTQGGGGVPVESSLKPPAARPCCTRSANLATMGNFPWQA
ncbi:MAG: hypothetical protein DMG97_42660 [Acidobacteria bacterium]|nr:MAG: hypothetical protein DMG97_42660 [Acidobacteriota bacterium]